MKTSTGIVLKKHFPRKQTITVLDKVWGKRIGVPPTQDICLGSLISYTTNQSTNVVFMHSLERHAVPLSLARNDLLFFHQVLELCYYFIPLQSPAPDVFHLVSLLCYDRAVTLKPLQKKVFLAKLFALLGVHPDEQKFQHDYFHYLRHGSIDTLTDQVLHLGIENTLDSWLRACISLHPYRNSFNTYHFLD